MVIVPKSATKELAHVSVTVWFSPLGKSVRVKVSGDDVSIEQPAMHTWPDGGARIVKYEWPHARLLVTTLVV